MPVIGRGQEPEAGFAVAVDLVVLTILDGSLEAFLVRRRRPPFQGCQSLPGGLVGSQEDVDEAAARVFGAATDLPLPYIEQLGTYGAPDRDPRLRVVSVAYLVLLPVGARPTAKTAAAAGGFFPVNPLIASSPASPTLAFDHRRIIADAVDRARSKLEYTTLAATLLPDEFTLGDLRRVYESVWGVGLHHSNFARKVRSVDGFVEPTGRRAAASGAPELFRQGPAALMMPALMRP
jgi:8-oxo-dGTP diphosphatase